jgi:phosphate transport system permease protein
MGLDSKAELRSASLIDRLRGAGETMNLQRQARPFETFIQYVLFICGAISILTTVAIILVLGTEAVRFFTRYGYVSSNQQLVEAVGESDTILKLDGTGTPLTLDQIILVNEEAMQVTQLVDEFTVRVARGAEGTTPEAHASGATVFLGERVSLVEFITGTRWAPQAADFGVLPLVMATLTTSFIAMLIAGPVGIGAAIYLSEYASVRVRSTLKPILEVLAAIPTVVYGYFALTFMTPFLKTIFRDLGIYNQLSAGLVMGVMIIPTIASISEDALSAVPRSLREASYGLGATRQETIFKVLLPAALSGILAAFILGISRAVGETMIVAVASGAGSLYTLNPLNAAETMTGHIARISTGDIAYGSIDYNSLFAIGLTLFIITFFLNIISNAIRKRFREVYA